MATVLWCYLRNSAFKKDGVDYHVAADLTSQANHLGVTIEADIIKQKQPENNGGFGAINFGKTHKLVYSELTSDNPIDLTRYQVAGCYMGRAGLINSGGASGDNDFADAAQDRGDQQARRRHGPDLRPQGVPAAHGGRRQAAEQSSRTSTSTRSHPRLPAVEGRARGARGAAAPHREHPVSVALHRALGMQPAAVAGHSLGEYSAVVAAGAVDFADALTIVHKRGRYMQEAVPQGKGAMVAILGVEEEAIRAAIAEQGGAVDIANYNAPGNVVIAGERAATLRAAERAGGKSRELAVSAPFHSRLMAAAEQRLAADLEALSIADPAVPIYNNVDAAAVTTAAQVRDGLKRQVTRSVLWSETIHRMAGDGISTFVEIGPGKVLTGLIRRIEKEPARHNVFDTASLEAVRAVLAR
jgi:[acyl-carrier-protein] S-malonyltransferase